MRWFVYGLIVVWALALLVLGYAYLECLIRERRNQVGRGRPIRRL